MRAVLLLTHLGAGGERVCRALGRCRRVQYSPQGVAYDHPDVIERLTATPHKYAGAAALWLDQVTHNHQLSHPAVLRMARPIYLVREPRDALRELLHARQLPAATAVTYYCFRLRRLYELARRTPGALCLFHRDLVGPWGEAADGYLGLREVPGPVDFVRPLGLRWEEWEWAERAYRRYGTLLRGLDLTFVN